MITHPRHAVYAVMQMQVCSYCDAHRIMNVLHTVKGFASVFCDKPMTYCGTPV